MKVAVLAVCGLLLCMPAFAKDQPAMKSAKVISQDITSYNAGAAAIPIGTMIAAVPITRRENIVVIETTTHRATLEEISRNGRNLLVLSVNDNVAYYVDGGKIIILDSNGKKHKFGVTHMEAFDNNSQK